MEIYKVLFVIEVSLCVIECRVFCQDDHASPWVPLGYSCPVLCENVINAIEKLKMMDYRIMIESDRQKKERMSSSYISSVINSLSSESLESDKTKATSDYSPNYYTEHDVGNLLRDQRFAHKTAPIKWRPDSPSVEQYQNIDNDIEALDAKQNGVVYDNDYADVQPRYKLHYGGNGTGHIGANFGGAEKKKRIKSTKMAGDVDRLEMELRSVLENTTCDRVEGGPYLLLRKMMSRCYVGRRFGYEGADFLRTLTKTMNRYSEASFEFTEDMVKLIIERVFGAGTRASGDLFDLGKLLNYLRSAVVKHRMHRRKEATIVLKPRHCLSLSIPGCFCRPGFVEKSGQCVRAEDCDIDPSNAEYINRVIIH